MPVAAPNIRTKLAAIVVALGLAVPLFVLAGPRLVAGLIMIPGSDALNALQERRDVPREHLETLIESREAGTVWIDSGRLRSDLALARLVLSERYDVDDETITEATDDLAASITAAPANPYAWIRLAIARKKLGAPDDAVARALVMSTLTGPHEPQIVIPRLRVGLSVWRSFSATDRDLMNQQIRYAMHHKSADIIALADNPAYAGLIRRALTQEPALLENFERRFNNLRQQP